MTFFRRDTKKKRYISRTCLCCEIYHEQWTEIKPKVNPIYDSLFIIFCIVCCRRIISSFDSMYWHHNDRIVSQGSSTKAIALEGNSEHNRENWLKGATMKAATLTTARAAARTSAAPPTPDTPLPTTRPTRTTTATRPSCRARRTSRGGNSRPRRSWSASTSSQQTWHNTFCECWR